MTIKINEVGTAFLVVIYNELSDKPVKKFKDRATAEERVTEILDEQSKTLEQTDTGWKVIDKPVRTSSRAVYGEHEEIEPNCPVTFTEVDGKKVYTTHNPKRKGSKAAARLQLLIDAGNMTVGEYLDACTKLEGNTKARYKYRIDLSWDIEHGFITFPNGADEA